MTNPAIATDSRGKSPPKALWVIAYLVSPALVFVCLRISGVVRTSECVAGVLVGLVVQFGMVSVLTQTNGNPLQGFLSLLMGLAIYLVVMWQFVAGQRIAFWSVDALKQWKLLGRFFGGLIFLSFIGNLALFHLANLAG